MPPFAAYISEKVNTVGIWERLIRRTIKAAHDMRNAGLIETSMIGNIDCMANARNRPTNKLPKAFYIADDFDGFLIQSIGIRRRMPC